MLSKKAEQINAIIDELKVKRQNMENLEVRTTKVIDEIETKLLNYLQNSKNLPSVATVTPITESLTALYKTNLDANSQVIRSMEKEIELLAKHGPDDNGDMPSTLSFEVLSELFQQSRNRQLVEDDEEDN
jgi:inhibitor of KinA sporulation pathway (predicted exonuclease)